MCFLILEQILKIKFYHLHKNSGNIKFVVETRYTHLNNLF